MAFDPDKYLKDRGVTDAPSSSNNGSLANSDFNRGEKKESPDYAAMYNPGVDMLRGAINQVRATTSQPILRFLAKHGYKPAQSEMADIDAFNATHQKSGMEKAGEIAADVGMLMVPTPFGKAGFAGKVLAPAAQGVLQHQAQNYAKTGEVSPGEALKEGAIATALPFGLEKAAPFLKSAGVGAAARGLGVVKKALSGANPVDIPYALENRLIPVFGGAKKMVGTLGKSVSAADRKLSDYLEKSGTNLNHADAMRKTEAVIKKLEKGNKLNSGSLEQMQPAIEQANRNALENASVIDEDMYPLVVPGKNARQLRKLVDENAKYDKTLAVPPPASTFNRALRNQYETQLDSKMAGTDLAIPYKATRQQIRKETPLLDLAVESAKKPHTLGITADAILGTEGAARALLHGSPTSMAPEIAAILARRLIFTPGGGRLLYEAGRGIGKDATQQVGRGVINLGRSAQFSHGDE